MDIYAQIQSLSNQLNELCELQNNTSRGGYFNGGQYNNEYPAINSFYAGNQHWDLYYNCHPQNYDHDYPSCSTYEHHEHLEFLQWQKEQEEKTPEKQKMDEIIQLIHRIMKKLLLKINDWTCKVRT
ncbi:hypothetical protein LIER_17069 [Lithospermum erythrorhizon]|uniref:Uncharacterized protein n=1 Tax=Lithospermum erythrorhizon TaxID=34254 RepID=A0AAV3QBJ8_LITER